MDSPANYFNQTYFSKNLDKLRILRKYLRSHPDFDPCNYEECVKLRSDGLQMTLKRNKNVDFALGDYIMVFGGVQQYLNIPVYDHRVSHIITALVYARRCNQEDGYATAIEKMSLSRSCEILCRLYNVNVSRTDERVKKLRKWCRRSPFHINEGLALFDEEQSEESKRNDDETLELVKAQLRISLDSVCPPLTLE